MSADTIDELPTTGTWAIDGSCSTVGFAAKHLLVATVRGRFDDVSGTVEVADPIEASSIDVTIEAASISTGDAERDRRVRGRELLDVATYPQLRYTATGVHHRRGDSWTIPGELTIRDVTRAVELGVDYLGIITDAQGTEQAAFSASTEIDREAFGVTWNPALEAGGVLVGRTVKVELEVRLVRV